MRKVLPKQKFSMGSFVQIAKDLGPTMRHFECDRPAYIHATYAYQYGGNDNKSYTLCVRDDNGIWSEVSWYDEGQLTAITDKKLVDRYIKEIKKQGLDF